MKLAAALMQFPYVVSAEELCNVFGVANSSADFALGMRPSRRLQAPQRRRSNTADMAKRGARNQRHSRAGHLRAAHRLIWTGEVEAVDETAAIVKTAEKLKVPTTKLIAARRRWSCPAQEAQVAQLAVQP